MKYAELKIISQKLSTYKKIFAIERVADTILKISFEKDEAYYFDLNRGDSYIYINEKQKKIKNYNAPFDVVLKKRFSNAIINRVELEDGNKILRFFTSLNRGYKSQKTTLQMEFTGRHTNIIILDENGIVLEALRHIDISNSFREVKVGVKLKELPKREFKDQNLDIDLKKFLHEEYIKRVKNRVDSLKKQKRSQLLKKRSILKDRLNSLEKEEILLQKADKLKHHANLILLNIDKIDSYQKEVVLKDYDGSDVKIVLPKECKSAANCANMIFNRSKKLKQKAKNLHIQRDNIKLKIEHLDKMMSLLDSVEDIDEYFLYFPKRSKDQKKREIEDSNIVSFFFQGFKILVGKNEKGNIELLRSAKMNDIWLHLKDIPSSHVIIRTDKSKIGDEVLEFAAKLCVNFSTKEKGRYLVDYTRRRDVKVREGAKVNYFNYKTLTTEKS